MRVIQRMGAHAACKMGSGFAFSILKIAGIVNTKEKESVMKLKHFLFILPLLLPFFGLISPVTASNYDHEDEDAGAVFTMTNAVEGNEILMYTRAGNGKLTFKQAYTTGGLGTGAGLGNQGGVVLSDNHRWLFVVNAGSDELSVFAVRHHRLILRDKIYTGGTGPVSVAVDRNLIYVLNAGSDTISGFTLGRHDNFRKIDGITDVSVLEKILHLVDDHDRAIVLRFPGRRAQMR